MSRRNLRQRPRISYYEPEEPSLDEYIFCDECSDFVFEYCAIHGPLLVVPDDKVPSKSPFPPYVPRAALTIPHVFLHLAPSIIPGAGLGVFSTLTLPRGVRFGPYCGQRTQQVDSMYCWQIYDRNNKRSHVVDAADGNRSNWMRYVNCARQWKEQNLLAYQYQGQLYYRTIKIIPRFTELMVFYGSEFANALHINLSKYNSPPGYAQKFGIPAAKKPKLDIRNEKINDTIPTEDKTNGPADTKIIDTKTKNSKLKSVKKLKKPISTIKPKLNNSSDKVNIKERTISNKTFIKPKLNSSPSKENIKETTIQDNSASFQSNNIYKDEFKCKVCNYKGINRNDIQTHSSRHSALIKQKGYLTIHKRIHMGQKSYNCDICQRSFSQKGSLNRHIRTHTGEKPYKCDICERSFNHKISLNTHINAHTGMKPYKCDTCLKRFSDKRNLKCHIRTHTGEKPYKCDICERSFNRKSSLNTHINAHTGMKPYKCDKCQKRFGQKGNLKSHIRTHTGEKAYKCDICERSFNRKSSLNTHINAHTGMKPYKCDKCQKRFGQKGNLKSHIRTHTGEKAYKCDICERSFNRKSSLKIHIRTHC